MKALTPISGSKRSDGFTLIELLLVCVLIALGAGLTSTFLSGSDQKEYSVNLRQISSLLRNARREAIVTGSEVRVRLASVAEPGGDLTALEEDLPDWANPDYQLRFAPSLEDSLEERAELEVLFFPMGSSTGGLLEFFDSERSTYLYLSPLTGELVVEKRLDVLEDQVRGGQW